MSRVCLAVLLLAAGCATYDPPVVGDRASAKYAADAARCRKQADQAATRKANATPQSAVMAMFGSGQAERQDMLACMQGRGYALRAGA